MTLSIEDRNSLIKNYIKKSETALESAVLLLKAGDYDGAANRAYYSIFQSEKALLLTKEIIGDKHTHVHRNISKEFVKTGELPVDTYQMIQKAQGIRVDGDYSGTKYVTKEEVELVISGAKKFFDITNTLINEQSK
jgi:uncharacterized protein (UPF0332 family)